MAQDQDKYKVKNRAPVDVKKRTKTIARKSKCKLTVIG